MPKFAGIILCGGQSTRMGVPKALLPFGNERLVQRVTRILSEVVAPVILVAAEGQVLPDCPGALLIVRDEHPDRGPLEGLRAGLKALPADIDAAYVSGVDAPLLLPTFVRQMLAELGAADVAVPIEQTPTGSFPHPLAAVYHRRILPQVEALLVADQRSLRGLLERANTSPVPVERLRTLDPDLRSLRNVNSPEEYQAALAALVSPLATDPNRDENA